jgi:predicted phosphohydrolase
MALKIQIASDLHLEFPENKLYLKDNPIIPNAKILVLLGDIVPFYQIKKHNDFFNYISKNFETTYWIPGNHEYYHSDISIKSGVFFEKIKKNIFLVNNSVVHIDNSKLIFSTLWTKLSVENEWYIERNMSDFSQIRNNGKRLSSQAYNLLHEQCIDFISSEINNTNEDVYVFTHHVPTYLNYPPEYKGSQLNEGFAVELYDFIEKSNIKFWSYGHHHSNTSKFLIGNTWLITNQLGYVQYNEHKSFIHDKLID